ncbi:hypothetical protein QFW77_04960 [Luteimonas sp. RD2P54]|uniref:Uncharacterized protein n=1 Tax=Luteimonas endophytica TaxID=3042023 RepID=A0ABT6J694_9GAMM|nr:hypothetical protein [Luteimonas endophytica]MDH5822341.1 hypothetical protein [Luteimonas endophytica]
MTANVALQRAEDDTLAEILTWMQEVVEGRGDSAAQMIVSVVLGCIPYVGQAVDAYNIVRSVHGLTKAPDSADNWINLALSLIAVVPLFGDALKNAFLMMRQGRKMGRVLDALPNHLRGNVERWFRQLDWARYTRELTATFGRIMTGMIDVLENRVTRWVLGREGVDALVRQLRQLQQAAPRRIQEAMDSLRQSHQRALQDPLPTTAGNSTRSPNTQRRATPGTQTGGNVRTTTAGTGTPASGQARTTQRQSTAAAMGRQAIGVSGEHIADYYFVRRQRRRAKVSHRGTLYEMKQPNGALSLGHHGIDHVWHASNLPHKYRVSDTKGSGAPFHRRLETAQQVWQALEYGIDAYLGEEDENRVRHSVGSTRGDGKQMSHRWIAAKIGRAQLTSTASAELLPKVEAWRRSDFKLGAQATFEGGQMQRSLVKCPYDRSLITVVGPNHNRHQRARGSTSGRCAKPSTSHQIGTEFVLPNHILRE